jgi:hypothetical protein
MKPTTYSAWKKPGVSKEVTLNMTSFKEFPDLIQSPQAKSVFQGVSLATKLKEAIAAEEEAATLKRLKKGETPELLLRECCAVLPCKGLKDTSGGLVPDWVTETQPIESPASYRHKSLQQISEERLWKRLGSPPTQSTRDQEDEDETISLPETEDTQSEAGEEENLEME